jgi:hypothetical protein
MERTCARRPRRSWFALTVALLFEALADASKRS